jgi:polyisoprenoid-binding protein YceI
MQSMELGTKAKWTIDPAHSEVGFSVRHLMVSKVRGEFKEYGVSVFSPGEDLLNADIDIWINPASISTGDTARNTHLKSAYFFDVEKYHKISFKGKRFEYVRSDMYTLYGELTIKGVTKMISLDVEFSGVSKDPRGGKRASFVVTGKINRKDWGLTWNELMESGGLIVGEDIFIKCQIELIKQTEHSL